MNSVNSLDKLCTIPLILSLVMLSITNFKKNNNTKNHFKGYTKYEIFENFVRDYVNKRIENYY